MIVLISVLFSCVCTDRLFALTSFRATPSEALRAQTALAETSELPGEIPIQDLYPMPQDSNAIAGVSSPGAENHEVGAEENAEEENLEDDAIVEAEPFSIPITGSWKECETLKVSEPNKSEAKKSEHDPKAGKMKSDPLHMAKLGSADQQSGAESLEHQEQIPKSRPAADQIDTDAKIAQELQDTFCEVDGGFPGSSSSSARSDHAKGSAARVATVVNEEGSSAAPGQKQQQFGPPQGQEMDLAEAQRRVQALKQMIEERMQS